MKVLGVPLNEFIACFAITTLLTITTFLPAISDFGDVLFGKRDMQFFVWLFWHYEKALEQGSDPFMADETFYPYGISLSLTTTTPLQGITYLLLPQDWKPFGKITFLQILSFVLGGIFSFALVYRFTQSFLPSLLGSVVFNFSVFHFEKALIHPNYSMAFPLLALFFIFYFEAKEQNKVKRRAGLLAFSLLMLALNEITVAVMTGFIVFIDIFKSYLPRKAITPRNIIVLAVSLLLSFALFEIMAVLHFPVVMIYTIPSLLFISACMILILGIQRLIRAERKFGYIKIMALAAIPSILYLGFLALYESYVFWPASALFDMLAYLTQIEYLFLPSGFQYISEFFGGLVVQEETGVYLGPLILAFIALSIKNASKHEVYFRDMFFLCLLFSFPIIVWGSTLIAVTPFIAAPLFPLLAFQRSTPRFMLFALLFLSVMVGLVARRFFVPMGNKGKLIMIILILLLVAERWPAIENFELDVKVPSFYMELAENQDDVSIFLYPNLNYETLLRETYAQTIHGKKLSYTTVSRFPLEGNELFLLYSEFVNPQEVVNFLQKTDYDYIVVQKLTCKKYYECFHEKFSSIKPEKINEINVALEERYGKAIYEDESVIVYQTS